MKLEPEPVERAVRLTMGTLAAVCAVNALGGGVYGLMGAEAVPREWLSGTPFHDYLVPSLVLLSVVGGAFSLGALAAFRHWAHGWRWSALAGAVVLGWLAVQVALIGYVSWLQPVMAGAGVVLIAGAGAWRELDLTPTDTRQLRPQQ